MISGIYQLIDASLVQQDKFNNIANNLANINANAFKKDIFAFDQVLMKAYTAIDFSPGPIAHTGNEFDIALDGAGFFKVQTSRGVRYTRDGSFSLNNERVLVNGNGDTVLGRNGPIKIEGNKVVIDIDGQVMVDNQPVDTISVVEFEEPYYIRKEGKSYYTYQGKEEEIVQIENPNTRQYYLERANVDPTEEMIKMIEAFRGFEAVQKEIQSIDEITTKMVNDPGLLQ